MAAAFPAAPVPQAEPPSATDGPVGSSAIVKGEGTKSEKQPTDPTQALPTARPGNKPLDKGVMTWTLKAVDHETADIDIDFKPDPKVEAKNVSFVQTVISKVGSGFAYGGACDLTGDEQFNKALSLKRAENARDYLVSKGIDVSRLEVQSYSFDWARVEAERGKSEGKNRRVQVWLHK